MPFTELVSPQAIIPALKANSKKQALQDLASKAAEITGRPEREILDVLTQREKLGSTALGAGIAIPHGKLSKLERIHGIFARLERPIDFEALDGQPVDLVFVLLAPSQPAPITSRHCRGLRACCATRLSPTSFAMPAMRRQSIQCSPRKRRRRREADPAARNSSGRNSEATARSSVTR